MRYEGAFAHLLQIRPWEWQRMSVAEVDRCVEWVEEYARELKEASQ